MLKKLKKYGYIISTTNSETFTKFLFVCSGGFFLYGLKISSGIKGELGSWTQDVGMVGIVNCGGPFWTPTFTKRKPEGDCGYLFEKDITVTVLGINEMLRKEKEKEKQTQLISTLQVIWLKCKYPTVIKGYTKVIQCYVNV